MSGNAPALPEPEPPGPPPFPFVCPNGCQGRLTDGDPYLARVTEGGAWHSSFKPDGLWRCVECFAVCVRHDGRRIITGTDESGRHYRITIEETS